MTVKLKNNFLYRKLFFFIFLFLFFSLIPTASEAANKYWVGTSGGNFSSDSNWSLSTGGANDTTHPISGDIAIFDGGDVDNASVDVNSQVTTFQILSGYTGVITVATGITLIANSNFTQADGTFNAGDTIIDINGYPSISGGTFNLQSALLDTYNTMTVSGGTFDGGTGDITFQYTYSDLTISGGTFTFPTGTTTLKDDLTIGASATVYENGTTLYYTQKTSANIDVPTTFTFTNLIIDSYYDNQVLTIASGDTLIVSSTLTLINGALSGSGTLEFIGPDNGFSMVSTFDGGTGLLKITGADTRNIIIPADADLPKFTLNAANTTIEFSGVASTTFESTLNLESGTINASSTDIVFSGAFTMTGGVFDAQNSNYLDFNSAAVNISGGTFNLQSALMESYETLNVSGGVFDGGTGNLTIQYQYSDLTISGGTFTFPTGTTTLKRNLTIGTNATVYENGTTLYYTHTTSANIDVPTTFTFTNLIIEGSSGQTITIASGDTLIVSSTLNLIDGRMPGNILEFTGTNFSISNTFDNLDVTTFNLTGTQDQTIDLTGVEDKINSDININKTSGTVTLNSGLTMDASSQDLTIIEGTLDLNGNTLIVNGSSGTMVVQDGGTLRMQGGETITTNASYPSFSTGSSAVYYGVSSYTLPNISSFYDVSFIGGGIYTPTTTLTATNNLTLSSGTLSMNGNNLTVSSTFSNDGTLRIQGGETLSLTNDTDSGTIEYVGNGDSSANLYSTLITDFYNLSLNFTDSGDSLDTNILNNGLGADWDFDADSGTTIDDSDNSNDGDITGAVWGITSGHNGNAAYTFDGNDYILAPDSSSLSITEDISISFWVKPTSISTSQMLVSKYDAGSNMRSFAVEIKSGSWCNSGEIAFTISSVGSSFTGGVLCSNAVITTSWHHVLVTFDPSTSMNIYIDGTDETRTFVYGSQPTGIYDNIRGLSLGAGFSSSATPNTGFFSGLLDDVRIYNKVLSSTEISVLAAGENSSYPNTTNINNNITLTSGTYSATGTLNITGDFLNTGGTFTANSSTVDFVGASQTISGENTFYNLTKTDSSANIFTLPVSTATTVNGTLTLAGASSNLLSLRSSSSGTQTKFDPKSTTSAQYLDVKDNNNLSSTQIVCTTGCTDSGNNTRWQFDYEINFSASTASGDEGTTTVSVLISSDQSVVSDVSVDYAISGGTAVGSGTDYTLSSGTASITNGNTTTSLSLTITDDDLVESDETLIISISNPVGGTLGSTTTYTYTITNDDTAGITISLSSVSVTEGSTTATYTAVLDAQPTDDVTVSAALSNSEISLSSADLTFTNANWDTEQTVTVTAVDDSEVDGETTTVISNTSASSDSNFDGLTIASVTATITDDDVASTGGGFFAPPPTPITTPTTEAISSILLNTEFFLQEEKATEVGASFHSVFVSRISRESITVTIESDPITLELVKGVSQKIDSNKDGILDLEIQYAEFINNDSVKINLINLTDESEVSNPVVINYGAYATDSRDVTITFNITNADRMAVSNRSDFANSVFTPFSSMVNWKLSVGNGVKTVYAKFLSSGGTASTHSDTITLNEITTEKDTIKETSNSGCGLAPHNTYKSSNSPAVYFITEDCKKRAFNRADVFYTYFDSWDNVETTTESELETVEDDTLGFMPWGPKYDPKYGALVKITTDPMVYLLLGGQKYWIDSENVFNKLNYSWNWIEDIDERLLNKYTIGEIINYTDRHPNYTLVKYENNTEVFRLEPDPADKTKQVKRHIKNEQTFKSLNFRWDRIVTIGDSEAYQRGKEIE